MSNKICNKCGKELPLTSFYKDKSKKDGYENTCKECRTKSKKKHTIICEVCGKSFKSRSKSSKYCSQECTNIGKGRTITERKANTWVCEVCGKEFTRPKCREHNENQHHFCSHECSQLFHRGENHPNWNSNLTDEEREQNRDYKEYEEWRTSVYEKDYYTCQCCGVRNGNGETIKLNAHHKDGYNWCIERRTDVTNGVTLCEDCHKNFHSIYGKKDNTEQQFIEFINNNGTYKGDYIYKSNPRQIPVICITTNKIFNSITEAGKFYNIKSTNKISAVCNGNRKSCGKLEDGTPLVWIKYVDYLEQQNNNNNKEVI